MKKYVKKLVAAMLCVTTALVSTGVGSVQASAETGVYKTVNVVSTVNSSQSISQLTKGDEYAVRDPRFSLTDSSVNRMASEHFQIIWGNSNSTSTAVTYDFVKGNLINLENIRTFYIEKLGMSDICYSNTGALSGKYKTNLYISNTGLNGFEDDWAYMSADEQGFAYLFLSPDAMRVDKPSWVVPHELAHAFTYHQGGTIDYAWYEATANWFRDQYLGSEYYAYNGITYGPDSDFFAPYMINGEYYVPHMLNWYDTWPIFLYISENPDNIDGLGLDLMRKIFQNNQSDGSMYATIERLSGVSIKTILGNMTKRLATMDFSRQPYYLEELNNTLSNDAENYGKIYTTLSSPDSQGYQSVKSSEAPMQTGFSIIPLNVDLSKDKLTADFVNNSGISGSDFRTSIVTKTNDNTTRYSNMVSGNGLASIELYGDEVQAYLVVCATPDKLKGYQVDWDSSANYEDTRYSYKVKITAQDKEVTEETTTVIEEPLHGDVDLDADIDSIDGEILMNYLMGIIEFTDERCLINAECDGITGIDMRDVVWILNHTNSGTEPEPDTTEATTEATTQTPVERSPLAAGTYEAGDILSNPNFIVKDSTSKEQIKIDENGYVDFGLYDNATVTINFKCGSSDTTKSAFISLYDKTSVTLAGKEAAQNFVVSNLDGGFYRIFAGQTGGTTAQIISITVAYG